MFCSPPATRRFTTRCTTSVTRWPWCLATENFLPTVRARCLSFSRLAPLGRRVQYFFQSFAAFGVALSLLRSRDADAFGHGRRRQAGRSRQPGDSSRRAQARVVFFDGFPACGREPVAGNDSVAQAREGGVEVLVSDSRRVPLSRRFCRAGRTKGEQDF